MILQVLSFRGLSELLKLMKKLLILAPFAALLAVISCSTGTPRCLRSNCNGCCDVNGLCQPGNEGFACGVAANTCTSCAQNEACADGVCAMKTGDGGVVNPPNDGGTGTCSATNCNGCCDGTGTCRGGNTNNSCGTGGIACGNCPSGQACQQQDGGAFRCSTFVCTGCNSTTGNCLLGTSASACGNGGTACKACLNGENCVSGACVMGGTCSAANCGGCCDGTACITNTTANKCGKMGASCTACSGTNVCNAGTCGPMTVDSGNPNPTGCGPSNCPNGCCDPLFDSCQAGDTNLTCGSGGKGCIPCLFGFTCQNKSCAL